MSNGADKTSATSKTFRLRHSARCSLCYASSQGVTKRRAAAKRMTRLAEDLPPELMTERTQLATVV